MDYVFKLCKEDECTGCGACAVACPIHCVQMEEYGKMGEILPCIDYDKCIQCGVCKEVCHINSTSELLYPKQAYVAYSGNKELRESAASGGVASSIYQYALEHEIFTMATKFDRKAGVLFLQVKDFEDILWARDSKYVWSDLKDCFRMYKEHLKKGKSCIFIGLPCQVAAIKQYMHINRISTEELITIELICHGVPNYKYFKEHIEYIEEKKKGKIETVSFREKSNYKLSFRGVEGKMLYKKPMHWNDEYYRAFSTGLIHRESCYNCHYAQTFRGADLTIGDYGNLGRMYEYSGEKEKVSLILCQTAKGKEFLLKLGVEGLLDYTERPLDEPMNDPNNKQLRHPMQKHKNRNVFAKVYNGKNFESAVRKALKREFLEFYLKSPYYIFRNYLSENMSKEKKERIKEILRMDTNFNFNFKRNEKE